VTRTGETFLRDACGGHRCCRRIRIGLGSRSFPAADVGSSHAGAAGDTASVARAVAHCLERASRSASALRGLPLAILFALRAVGSMPPSWPDAARVHRVPSIFARVAAVVRGGLSGRAVAAFWRPAR
jgi:hypothetical protein